MSPSITLCIKKSGYFNKKFIPYLIFCLQDPSQRTRLKELRKKINNSFLEQLLDKSDMITESASSTKAPRKSLAVSETCSKEDFKHLLEELEEATNKRIKYNSQVQEIKVDLCL